MSERVRAYYDEFDEWGRLETPAGRLEYERTWAYLQEHLPPNAAIVDIGSGPGRYALALAAAGHEVSLVDPSPVQIATAQAKAAEANALDRLAQLEVGVAEDLSRFSSNSFDAALALGPFYHLTERQRRQLAASELHRVLKPGGVAFVSFIPKLSGLAGLLERAASDVEQITPTALSRAAERGVFLNPTPRGFQDGYYAEAGEMQTLFREAGLLEEDLLSLRGLAYGSEAALQSLRSRSRSSAMAFDRLIEASCRESAVVALCGHALLRVRKPVG